MCLLIIVQEVIVKKLIPIGIIAAVLAVIVVPGAMAQNASDVKILTWEYIQDETDGQLEWLTSTGDPEVLVKFPAGVFDNQAKPCSQDYWADEGKGIALFTGAASGNITIYPLAGGEPVQIGSAHRMSCSGPATFQFSPNGQRVGYINYVHDALEREFPVGDLVLVEAATGTQLGGFDWTTAFALADDGALMLRLFPDGKGNAVEGDVDWWDGSGRRTLVTLEPVFPADAGEDFECGLTSGAVARAGNTAYVLTGQKCENGASNWRLVSIPMAGGAATEIAFGQPGGGFFPESFTTQLLPAQDGSGFLMMVPSGLARNTVSLSWVTKDGAVTPVLEGQHVLVDRFGERLTEGRHTILALDGSAVAFVAVTGDGQQTLYVLDLSRPGNEPVELEKQGAGERIFQYLWAANQKLYYASGTIETSSLSMAAIDGSTQRVARGRFFRIATNYAGDKIAAAEWFANPERLGDDLFKLTLLDVNGSTSDFKVGGADHAQYIPLAVQ